MPVPVLPASHHNLLGLLLHEQGELSAVERFSDWHASQAMATSTYQALMPATPLKDGQQYGFEVDLDACSGCKACVVACHSLNGLEETETWRKVGALASQSLTSLPIVQHVTTACHHCVDPGCLHGCPVQAYEKDPVTGIVRHLDDQCFGCKYCTMMCPYEVPQYNATLGIVRKCDMCSQRLAVGEAPACVQACPNQAIRIAIVDVAKVTATAAHNPEGSLVATAPLSRFTIPTTRYVSQRMALQPEQGVGSSLVGAALVSSESTRDRAHEGHLPLVLMIVLTQASVGMWVVLAAAGLLGFRDPGWFAAGIATAMGIIGVHAALLHLGRPWLAYRAFLGWRRSWLSREAIAFGLYMGLAVGAVACKFYWGDGADASMLRQLDRIVAAGGMVAVACTGMIYIATGRQLWGSMRTGTDFALSTVGLGLVGANACMNGLPSSTLAIGVFCSIGAVWAKGIDFLRGNAPRGRWEDFSARSGRVVRAELGRQWAVLWLFHSVCIVAAVGLASVAWEPAFSNLRVAIFAACLAAQGIHRWIYFASVVYRRMPGAST